MVNLYYVLKHLLIKKGDFVKESPLNCAVYKRVVLMFSSSSYFERLS